MFSPQLRYESRRYGRKSAPTVRDETIGQEDFITRSYTPQPIATLNEWVPTSGRAVREEIAHIHMGSNSPRNRTPKAGDKNDNLDFSKSGTSCVGSKCSTVESDTADSISTDRKSTSHHKIKHHRKAIMNNVTFSSETTTSQTSPKDLFKNSFKRHHHSARKSRKGSSSRQKDSSKKSKKKSEGSTQNENAEETGGEA